MKLYSTKARPLLDTPVSMDIDVQNSQVESRRNLPSRDGQNASTVMFMDVLKSIVQI